MASKLVSASNISTLVLHCRYLHFSALNTKGLYAFFNRHKKVTDPARQDPDYFEKVAAKLPLDDHYVDALKSIWEEKYGSERDLSMKAEDYLIGNTKDYAMPTVDSNQPQLKYRGVKALDAAPESVKRIFSVGFASTEDIANAKKYHMMRSVNLHEYDMVSLQSQVAWATGCIREWSELVDVKIARHKQNKKPKYLINKILRMLIHRRYLLTKLKEKDADEYAKVMSELKINHRPPESLGSGPSVMTRKGWSEEQLRNRLNKEKETKLLQLYRKLMDGREEKVAGLEKELDDLNKEEEQIKRRTAEILNIEGKTIEGTIGKYQPKIIEELTEISLHSALFYHPTPAKA